MRTLLALALAFPFLAAPAWSQCTATRFLPTGSEFDFGEAVAINLVDGVLIAAIGAPGDDAGGSDAGAIIVYTSVDGGAQWTGPTRLVAGQPSVDARLGASLALDDQGRLVAGAPGANYGVSSGAVLVFRWDGAMGFQENQVLLPSDGVPDQEFGSSLSLEAFGPNNASLLIGAPGHSSDAGAAYGFSENSSTVGLEEYATWTAPSPSPGDRFGEAVQARVFTGPGVGPDSLSMLVGAPGRQVAGVETGAVFVGSSQPMSLPVSGLLEGDRFGAALSAAGIQLMVGAPGRDGGSLDEGSVFALSLQWPATVLDTTELLAPVQESGAGFGSALTADPTSWRRAHATVGALSQALQSARLLAIGEEDQIDWTVQRSSAAALTFTPRSIAAYGDGLLLGGVGPLGPEVRWTIHGGRDANANGQPDTCDILNDPSLDLDQDGLLDEEGPSVRLTIPMSLFSETPPNGVVLSTAESALFQIPLVSLDAGYLEEASFTGTFEAGGLERIENLNATEGAWTTFPFPGQVQLFLNGHLGLSYYESIDDCGCNIWLEAYDGVTDYAGDSGQFQSYYAERDLENAWLSEFDGPNHRYALDTETFLGDGLTDLEVTVDVNWNTVSPTGPGPFERDVQLRVEADFELSYLLYPAVLDSATQSNHCTSNPNSTGQVASLVAGGSAQVTDDLFVLMADDLPTGQVGYFLTSRTAGNVPFFGGSEGTLCLGSPILRLAADILTVGADNRVTQRLDLAGLPTDWTVASGETRYFQFWFRDVNPGTTSNTSDGLMVTFQ